MQCNSQYSVFKELLRFCQHFQLLVQKADALVMHTEVSAAKSNETE